MSKNVSNIFIYIVIYIYIYAAYEIFKAVFPCSIWCISDREPVWFRGVWQCWEPDQYHNHQLHIWGLQIHVHCTRYFKSIRSFYLKFLNLLSSLYICLHMILITAWNHVHVHKGIDYFDWTYFTKVYWWCWNSGCHIILFSSLKQEEMFSKRLNN